MLLSESCLEPFKKAPGTVSPPLPREQSIGKFYKVALSQHLIGS